MTACSPDPYPDFFVLLTGGGGRRLGGVDKASLEVGGQTLLDRAVHAAGGRPVIVVGPDPGGDASVLVTREDPPGGGPAAGVAAGVAALDQDEPGASGTGLLVAVQAVDQIGVTRATWRRLAAAARDVGGGAILLSGGRRQYGVGVFPLEALRGACGTRATWHGHPLRELIDPVVAVEIDALGAESRDIDTLEDLTWWRSHADAPRAPDEAADGIDRRGEPR